MRVEAVLLDVGETLVNEDRYWREVAAVAGLDPHVVLAALRRGPWGRLQPSPAGALVVCSLSELPDALASHA